MECGGHSGEKQHFREGKHSYREFEVIPGFRLVLCDFCMVDFGSFDPKYFGLPPNTQIGYERMNFIREIESADIGKDKYCLDCGYRLKFLDFVKAVREQNAP